MKPESNTILPAPDILNNLEYGKFVLSNLAAKRAKQLKEGAPPLIRIESNHPLSIALAEIAAGKIRPILSAEAEHIAIEVDNETIDIRAGELGLLLPALDDAESEILGVVSLVGEDIEEDILHDDKDHDASSLSDLLDDTDVVDDDEDEEDDVVEAADSDTLSLTDIEEEEKAAEDGDLDSE